MARKCTPINHITCHNNAVYFELRQIIHPIYPPGQLRIANLDDLALLTAWRIAFTTEVADQPQKPEQVAEGVQHGIEAGSYFFWDHQGAVALAAKTRPTPHGIAIGPVYTPPEQRNRGYASALVNLAWAPGQTLGAVGGGALAHATRDTVPYLALAAVCALTLLALWRFHASIGLTNPSVPESNGSSSPITGDA